MENEKRSGLTGFFGFVVDAAQDEELLNKFLKTQTLDQLKKFFVDDNPYYGLSEAEIARLNAYRENLCDNNTSEEIYQIVCGGRGY